MYAKFALPALYYLHYIITSACDKNFRKKTNRRKNNSILTGWTDFHTDLRDTSRWWHWLWVNNRKPVSGQVYHIMKMTRCRYHCEINNLKKETKLLRLNALIDNAKDSKKFYALLKSYAGKSSSFSPTINNKHFVDASNEFANDIVNNQNMTTDHDERDRLLQRLFGTKCDNVVFSVNNIKNAICRLRPNKNDTNTINSSVIKMLGSNFLTVLTSYFNSSISHGYVPNSLLSSTLNPLLKHIPKCLYTHVDFVKLKK